MTCEHCVRAVTEELSALPGVDAVARRPPARRDLHRDVSSYRPPATRAAVAAAVDEAGYALAAS